jgi:ATP-dependent DNA helicase RecQ
MIDSNQPPYDEKRLLRLLKEHWGFDDFRPVQKGPVQSLSKGVDSLAVLPTGGGKSLCYQVTGLYRGGICVVISPLIALIEDQVHDLRSKGLNAISLAGNLSYRDIERLLDNAERMRQCFLYCSPERLRHPLVASRLTRLNVLTIAVDEAHCISQWGHDFRPAYRNLSILRETCSKATMGAFTATATSEVSNDIIARLKLSKPQVFIAPMARENLIFSVLETGDAEAELLRALNKSNGIGLVYVSSRSESEIWARRMQEMGLPASAYHAGLTAKEREETQEAWMSGRLRILACTSAFGMGIDKQDVRFVFHASPPQNLESYVQEAGRAGRDQSPSACVLFVNVRALNLGREKLERKLPKIERIQEVYQGLANQGEVSVGSQPQEATRFDCNSWLKQREWTYYDWKVCMDFLERAGYIKSNKIRKESVFEISLNDLSSPAISDMRGLSHDVIAEIRRQIEGKEASATIASIDALATQCGVAASLMTNEVCRLKNLGVIECKELAADFSIQWIRPREESKNVILSKELGEDWFRSLKGKWNAMEAFVKTTECRQTYIQSYFGLHEVEDCGSCDNCLKKDYVWARSKWLSRLPEEGVDIKSWVDETPVRFKSVLFHFLQEWVESNEIDISNATIYRL